MSSDKIEVVIVSAARTPIGSFLGALSTVKGSQLGSLVIKEVLARASVDPSEVNEVIMGQVLPAGAGQNPARQAAVHAGVPIHVPATTVNIACGSGLKSVSMAMQAIRCGEASVVVAGGQESMSLTPHMVSMRVGHKLGDSQLIDHLLLDGLTDAFSGIHMGVTAENIAKKYSISREEQDEYACRSQALTRASVEMGRFTSQIVPVPVKTRKGVTEVAADEFPRPETTTETLAKLKPVFITDGTGTVTAGNASGINDGAGAVLVMSAEEAARRHLQPLARIVSSASCGVDPTIMGTGPIPATRLALERAGWSMDDVDLFEINEAFASQVLAVVRELGAPMEKVNVNGGSISLGHPLGASGTRVLITLLYSLRERKLKKGLATLCIGGGMGIAMCVETM